MAKKMKRNAQQTSDQHPSSSMMDYVTVPTQKQQPSSKKQSSAQNCKDSKTSN